MKQRIAWELVQGFRSKPDVDQGVIALYGTKEAAERHRDALEKNYVLPTFIRRTFVSIETFKILPKRPLEVILVSATRAPGVEV